MVFLRVAAILFFAPFFGSEAIPARVKIPMALVIAFALASSLGLPTVTRFPSGWTLAIGGELLVGIAIGFVGRILIGAVEAGGQIVGLQMGFGIVNVIDPLSNINISIVGQFYFMIAMLLFFAINGHHRVIEALSRSFAVVPPGQVTYSSLTSDYLITMSSMVFSVAVRIAAPVIVALLLVSVTTGIIARTIPQINFLIVGFAFRILVGMGMLLIGTAFYVGVIDELLQDMGHSFLVVVRTFGPR
jgi:flagellar biosynthetic protein FliR